MVLADAIAVAVGLALGKQLPQRRIGQFAAALFVIFGVVTMASAFVSIGSPLTAPGGGR